MRKTHWNKEAKQDYFNNIDYLLQGWTEKEAQEFIDQVDKIENLLIIGKVDFQNTNIPNVKRCVISKQVTLFYKVIDPNNIEFLCFWNNYQDDKNRKL